ncbi:hypothetical protein B0T22DRAFT_123229 [Podospora appendiculata]|uniref:Postreplication repair E3 ubiquitin-protein ligase RAD18 n=1 Tax=Podospora appendiculata TaxID=314037 RepID=A0AAE0X759_9PEZI|nr:hypothetical protein B0T22DRAFT_123229 [Podospora appendiculata]
MDVFNDEAFDVPDSTDWLGTPLAGLMQVEQAFRCHVCKDFYQSPMLTSCNHTFCSLCIRRCLSVDGNCPLCRASDQESKLRGNWALREAVDSFVAAREALLQIARAPPPAAAAPGSPKRKAMDLAGPEQDYPETKRPRMSTRSSKTKSAETTAAMMRAEIDVPESRDTTNYEPDDGLVECPICSARIKMEHINRHIDSSCTTYTQPKRTPPPPSTSSATRHRNTGFATARSTLAHSPSPSTAKPKAPERLPTLNYSMLKDTALRKKMNELGIPASGSRQMLERRHQEWMTLWNANCDSAKPKKRQELLHDLDIWEKTMGARAPTTSRAATVGAQIKDKNFDGAAWAAKHDTSFQDLIASARRTRKQVEQKARENSEAERAAAGLEPEPGRREIGSGAGGVDAGLPQYPEASRVDFMDLTLPPSSQAELPDIPEQNGVQSGPYCFAPGDDMNGEPASFPVRGADSAPL